MIFHDWLDKLLVDQISGVFAEEWTLEHLESEEEYHEKHGSCIRCSYRFRWNPALGFQDRKLPIDYGPNLMRLIRNAARGADPPACLVQTKTKGKHDFCDWGWVDEEDAHLWVFLDPSEVERQE